MSAVRLFPLEGGLRRHPMVDQWFEQSPLDLRLLAKRWFDEIRSCGDDVVELLHDGNPTACVAGVALCYVATYRAHVNVGFYLGATLPDPVGLLQGTGRFMRHAKVHLGPPVNEKELAALIAAAYTDLKVRLASVQLRDDQRGGAA